MAEQTDVTMVGDGEEYQPKSILLTGGAGFIGSNVMQYLTRTYSTCTMVCLDCMSYCASDNNFKDLLELPNFTFVKGDITSVDLVNYIMDAYHIDTVMHFAAETHVDNSFGNSFNFTKSNVLGTHTLLESAKKFKSQIRRFIHVSTDEVYGESNFESERNTVDAVLNPTNPYSATKAAAEFMVRAYQYSYNLPIIVTRGNNVYGPRQYPEKLIPKFILLINQGKPCPLHGDGSNRRSFLHVQDVVSAFDHILRKGKLGEVYNIGSSYEVSNKEVLLMLLDTFGITDKKSYINYVSDRAFNDFRYHIDTIALEALGWRQKISFEEGIKLTKQWYLANPNWWIQVENALKAHPFAQSIQFTMPQRQSSIAGNMALKKIREEDEAKTAQRS